MCWRILWHTSVHFSSCMTYCEKYSNFLFHLIILRKLFVIFWTWNQVNLRRRMQKFRSVLSGIEKNSIYILLWKIYFKYMIIHTYFITCLISLSIPSDFIPFCALLKTFFAISSPFPVPNITNTHFHSQHSPIIPFYRNPFSYVICSKS